MKAATIMIKYSDENSQHHDLTIAMKTAIIMIKIMLVSVFIAMLNHVGCCFHRYI
jgi:hypothetical protein